MRSILILRCFQWHCCFLAVSWFRCLIPKGLHLSALGCEERATQGRPREFSATLKGLKRSWSVSRSKMNGRLPMNLGQRTAPSPPPNGFPSPPRVRCPARDVRFAHCGPPVGEREKISCHTVRGFHARVSIRGILSPVREIFPEANEGFSLA